MNNETEIIKLVEDLKLQHIAIIMDGNRRWAKERHLPSSLGHKKGVDALKKIVRACDTYKIKYLTLYAFSTENWKRTQEEVNFLMQLFIQTISNELNELNQNAVKIKFIGDLEPLDEKLKETLLNAEEKTKDNNGVNLQIAINYGARDEIKNTIKKIIKNGIKEDEITEELISDNLYTKGLPDPDLLIRTGGEMRISNYLLWQIAYSEIYVTKTYWPEFDSNSLDEAIKEYAKRQRRYGS